MPCEAGWVVCFACARVGGRPGCWPMLPPSEFWATPDKGANFLRFARHGENKGGLLPGMSSFVSFVHQDLVWFIAIINLFFSLLMN